jgi:hypothetical protein
VTDARLARVSARALTAILPPAAQLARIDVRALTQLVVTAQVAQISLRSLAPIEAEPEPPIPPVPAPRTTVLSGSIGFTADDTELLNNVIVSNNADPPVVAQALHDYSVGVYGPFSEAMGFPRRDLAFTDTAAATAWCQRVVNRYGLAISRANDIEADTHLDPAWTPWLADMDTGQAIKVERTELQPFTLDAVVVGFEHRITRNRWQATLHTDTITPTF